MMENVQPDEATVIYDEHDGIVYTLREARRGMTTTSYEFGVLKDSGASFFPLQDIVLILHVGSSGPERWAVLAKGGFRADTSTRRAAVEAAARRIHG